MPTNMTNMTIFKSPK